MLLSCGLSWGVSCQERLGILQQASDSKVAMQGNKFKNMC